MIEYNVECHYVVGYGTFMTQGLRNVDMLGQSSAYGVPFEILRTINVKNYKRLARENSKYPYAIRSHGDSFIALLIKLDQPGWERLKVVEGYPALYVYDVVLIPNANLIMDIKIFIASPSTYDDVVRAIEEEVHQDLWVNKISKSMNTSAKILFPELI